MIHGIDHVGVVVENLDDAARFMTDVLGFSIVRRASVPDRVDTVVVSMGPSCIELMDTRPARSAKEVGPDQIPSGHIAIEVEDLESAIADLRRAGVETTKEEPSVTEWTRSYFSKPETTYGIAMQFVQNT